MSKSMYEYGHGAEQKDRNLEQTIQDKEFHNDGNDNNGKSPRFKRPLIAAIIATLIIVVIIIIVVLIRKPWSGKAGKTSGSGELSEELLDGKKQEPTDIKRYERDGQTYELRSFRWFDMEVQINDMTVVSKEPLENVNTFNMSYRGFGGESGYDESVFRWGINMDMPQLFYDENISSVEYTAQNGITLLSLEGISDGKATKYNYQHYKATSVTVGYDQQASVKLSIMQDFNHVVGYGNGDLKYEGASHYTISCGNKEELVNTIIKAVLTYKDGTKETVYIGMELPGEYNTSRINFYRLTME